MIYLESLGHNGSHNQWKYNHKSQFFSILRDKSFLLVSFLCGCGAFFSLEFLDIFILPDFGDIMYTSLYRSLHLDNPLWTFWHPWALLSKNNTYNPPFRSSDTTALFDVDPRLVPSWRTSHPYAPDFKPNTQAHLFLGVPHIYFMLGTRDISSSISNYSFGSHEYCNNDTPGFVASSGWSLFQTVTDWLTPYGYLTSNEAVLATFLDRTSLKFKFIVGL